MQSKFELFTEKAFEILQGAGIDIRYITACPYELILESDLISVVDRIIFQATRYHGVHEFITEITLHPQDVFLANEWGLFLLNTDSPSDLRFEEHTFPDER